MGKTFIVDEDSYPNWIDYLMDNYASIIWEILMIIVPS